jgi:hypothetical protein
MASRLCYLYLSRSARANVEQGLDAGRWGLTDEAVQRRLEWLSQPTTGLEILQFLQLGQ